MTQQQIIEKLQTIFAEVEKNGASFSEDAFFKRPPTGKWSAAENIQHLFLSAKPLVGLFGKPDFMKQQWGESNRPSTGYDDVVKIYLEKIGNLGAAVPAYVPDGLCATQSEQLANLHSIHQKFLERASALGDEVLDNYQVPHPLIGLLTVREFLYFTHYHTSRHNDTIVELMKNTQSAA